MRNFSFHSRCREVWDATLVAFCECHLWCSSVSFKPLPQVFFLKSGIVITGQEMFLLHFFFFWHPQNSIGGPSLPPRRYTLGERSSDHMDTPGRLNSASDSISLPEDSTESLHRKVLELFSSNCLVSIPFYHICLLLFLFLTPHPSIFASLHVHAYPNHFFVQGCKWRV